MRFVIFLDALDPQDVREAGCQWLTTYMQEYKAATPIITPNNVSMAMIADVRDDIKDAKKGARQEDLPFTRSTPYREPKFEGTDKKTILHYASEVKDLKVFSFGIPLMSVCELPEGSQAVYDHLRNGRQPVPAEFQFVQEKKDYDKDDSELILHSHLDYISNIFSSVRSMARNNTHDVLFIGLHDIDVHAHWYNKDRKLRIIQFLEHELKALTQYGEILVWSDHGATVQRDDSPFFINKWLKENGWLFYEIDMDLVEAAKPKWKHEDYPDSLPLGSPFVKIDWSKTKFYSADAFDSMIDATYRATKKDMQELKTQLMETGYYDSVTFKHEIFDRKGLYYRETPSVMPETSDGVNVSCNVHPQAKNGENLCRARRGWHSNRGCIIQLCDPLKAVVEHPRDLYTAMKEFIDRQEPKANETKTEDLMQNIAHDLGY